jgi:hypothetical protein
MRDIPQRLKKFVTHDIKRNPILGLYLVIGLMVVGYLIYFAGIMYRDISGGAVTHVASKAKTKEGKKASRAGKSGKSKPKATSKKATRSTTGSSGQKTASQKPVGQDETVQPAQAAEFVAKTPSEAPKHLDYSSWPRFEFRDTSYISFPPDWSRTELPPEKNMLYGIRLRAPVSTASLKCYGRARHRGENLAKSLKETFNRQGQIDIKETRKRIGEFDIIELSGRTAGQRMLLTIFDYRPDRYFIVSLITPERDLQRLHPYYDAILASYGAADAFTASASSIETLEQQLFQGVDPDKGFWVGSYVWIKLKNGKRHTGLVIAEDDKTYTLESSRFGGKYSFNINKNEVAEISN